MTNWQKRQNEKQLRHYSTKRRFNHKVKLKIKASSMQTPRVYQTIPIHHSNLSYSYFRRTAYELKAMLSSCPWKPPQEIEEWLKVNVDKAFYKLGERNEFYFTRIEDAIAFKLRWC